MSTYTNAPDPRRGVEDRSKAGNHGARDAVRVDRIEDRRERGQLDGDVDARQRRAVVVAIDQRIFGLRRDGSRRLVKQRDVLVAIGVRFAIRNDRFAEGVESDGEMSRAQRANRAPSAPSGSCPR